MRPVFRPLNVQLDWPWIQENMPIHLVDDTSGVTALDLDTSEILGICIMDNWTPNSVQAHLIMPNPMLLRHGFLTLCYDLVFDDMGCKYVYGQVPSDNAKALKLNKRMGFTVKTRLKDAFADDVDYIIMELKAENRPMVTPTVNKLLKVA